ncbi:MAG: hypothetical protein Q9225_005996 [Loekoesia sp. 1 TL-2023]
MVSEGPRGKSTAQDITTGEEISSTTIPPSTPTKDQDTRQQRNAFTELLSPSKKIPSKPTSTPSSPHAPQALTTFTGRAGLGAYTHSPESFPPSRVISFNDSYVTINDLYPKSSVHVLLLPRLPEKQLLHPFEALQDPLFLSSIQKEVKNLRILVAKELQRRFGRFSAQERKREEAIEKALDEGKEVDEASLPEGRDWSKDVIAGVHTHPSMSHLHVHLLSVDRHNVEDFPLTKDDMVRRMKERWLDRDMVCWRCGRNFKNKFKALKDHLEEEFEEWKND